MTSINKSAAVNENANCTESVKLHENHTQSTVKVDLWQKHVNNLNK